jgi:hypothetical protein
MPWWKRSSLEIGSDSSVAEAQEEARRAARQRRDIYLRIRGNTVTLFSFTFSLQGCIVLGKKMQRFFQVSVAQTSLSQRKVVG